MKRIVLKIKNEQGLHARPSTKFVETVDYFDGKIEIHSNDQVVNGKNVMGLMLLSLGMNDEFTVVANSNCNDENSEIEVLEKVRHLVEVLKFNE